MSIDLNKNCESCRLDQTSQCKSPRLLPQSVVNPTCIVVGSIPTATDDRAGKMFQGTTSNNVKSILKEVGFNLSKVLFTSALRCKPDSIAGSKELELCGESVRDLIEQYQPDSVICLGSEAVRSVFPKAYPQVFTVAKTRGSKVPYFTKSGKAITCVITYAHTMFSNSIDANLEQVFVDDIASALDTESFDIDLNVNVILCKDIAKIKECAAKLKKEEIVGFDFETTSLKPYGKPGKVSELFSVAFAFDDGTSYAIPLYNHFPVNIQKAINELVREFFYSLNPDQVKVGHNTKFDMLWALYKLGDKLEKAPQGHYEDTSLLCWLNDERGGMSKLKVAGFRYFGVNNWSVDVKDVRSLPLDDVLVYNALDSFYTLRLLQYLKPRVCNTDEVKSLYNDLLLPSMMQFLKVEMRGVDVDESLRSRFYEKYKKDLELLVREIREISGVYNFNPGSPIQLQNYFIKDRGYKLYKKTKTGYSTDADTMQMIVDKYNDPVAKKILQYSAMTKMQSTYIEGLGKHIYNDGKLHGGFNLTATVTGRTSSNEPNMQNFPKTKGKEIRGIVVAPKGYKLCSFDFGQIEARLFAIVTGDKTYLSDLYNHYDIHLEQAIDIYQHTMGMSKEQATKKRGAIKNGFVFPAFYGAGAHAIAENLNVPEDVAIQALSNLFKRYPAIKKWQRQLVLQEAKLGYIESLYGRRRRSPIKYNQLLNFTTQATASDMLLTALNYVGRKYDVAFTVHDDLSTFLPDDDKLDSTIRHICDSMLVLPWLHLSKSKLMKAYAPLQVECEVGNNWADQKPYLKIDSIEAGYDTLEKSLEKANKVKEEFLAVGW